ncbi:MAG: biopolymer transporter ExbD [Candidatus Solibacter sp.]|nr:biopolymer transporter ExbD [Candidatus Solibacter sp.]
MAFSFQNEGRGRRRGGGTLAEINIVPLVDVVLVLLVIFMLTAHVMEFGLEVEVPRVRQVRDSAEELPVITITKGGELYLNEQQVNINQLGEVVRAKFPNHKAVYVRADRSAIWDPIAQVISALGEAKLEPRMVTQPVDSAKR